jgi:hypothetical protein
MKKIVTIAIILLLNLGGWAQENKNEVTQKILSLENRVNTLENQQKLFDAAIDVNKKSSEAEFNSKLNKIIEENRITQILASIIAIIGFAAIVGFLFQLFGGFKKMIEKKTIELRDKFEVEFEKQANAAKKALNEAIKEKGIEIDLKQKYRLNILYNGTTNENLSKMYDMLNCFGFSCTPYDQIVPSMLNEYDIILFYDDTNISEKKYDGEGKEISLRTSKWLSEQLTHKEILELKDTCGFLFINKNSLQHNFKEKGIDCFSASNSFATIYENLMSLLHYKRYLNSHQL